MCIKQDKEQSLLFSFHTDVTSTSLASMSSKTDSVKPLAALYGTVQAVAKGLDSESEETSIFLSLVLKITGGHWYDLRRMMFPANPDSFLCWNVHRSAQWLGQHRLFWSRQIHAAERAPAWSRESWDWCWGPKVCTDDPCFRQRSARATPPSGNGRYKGGLPFLYMQKQLLFCLLRSQLLCLPSALCLLYRSMHVSIASRWWSPR